MAFSSGLAARTMSAAAAASKIQTVTVIGSGLMGAGVAQVAAQAGNRVHLVDINETAVTAAQQRINESIKRVAKKKFKDDAEGAEKFISSSISQLTASTDSSAAAAQSDLVIEAIVENLSTKQKLFSALDKVAPAHTIFASNTSSLSIADIASTSTRLDRFAGLHFFNPVPVMKLLEVVRIPETSEETYDSIVAWGNAIGKVTVQCKDTPGFIVNRLLVPYMGEAVRMLERGDASARDIDTAMKLGAGYPMGPLELADYTGLDTNYYIMNGWAEEYPENPLFAKIPLLEKLFKEGKFGRKSGEGFYKY